MFLALSSFYWQTWFRSSIISTVRSLWSLLYLKINHWLDFNCNFQWLWRFWCLFNRNGLWLRNFTKYLLISLSDLNILLHLSSILLNQTFEGVKLLFMIFLNSLYSSFFTLSFCLYHLFKFIVLNSLFLKNDLQIFNLSVHIRAFNLPAS